MYPTRDVAHVLQVVEIGGSQGHHPGGSVLVRVALEESAQLYSTITVDPSEGDSSSSAGSTAEGRQQQGGGAAQQVDGYSRSAYEALYSMVRVEDGTWRVARAQVLTQPGREGADTA